MKISVKCPACGVSLNVPEERLGKQAKCPKCQKPFVPAAPQPEPKRPVATKDDFEEISDFEEDDDYEEDDEAAEAFSGVIAPRPTTRTATKPSEYPKRRMLILLSAVLKLIGAVLILWSIWAGTRVATGPARDADNIGEAAALVFVVPLLAGSLILGVVLIAFSELIELFCGQERLLVDIRNDQRQR